MVVRLSSIGDVVLTTPLVRRLRKAYPDAAIDFLTKSALTPLFIHNTHLSRVLTPDTLPQPVRYDVVIDLQNSLRSRRILLESVRAASVLRYRKENWKKWLLVQFKLNLLAGAPPIPDRYAAVAQTLNLVDDGIGCEIFLSDAEKTFAERHLPGSSKKIAVCFGAKHFTKRFPPERVSEVITRVLKRCDAEILLLGGAEDAAEGKAIASMLTRFGDRIKNFSGACSLLETAALLRASDAVLTNDTGLMHLASAFQKKIIVLFGSSVKAFGFLPYRTPYRLFEVSDLGCRPCSHIGRDACPETHFRCMLDLSVDAIADATVDAVSDV